MPGGSGSFAMNPLNSPGEVFDLGLMNPNPSSSKTKDGPVYRISFEVERETWDLFMEAETKGMLIAAKACVADTMGENPVQSKPEKGPHGEFARDLVLSGFFNSGKVREYFGGDKAYQDWCRQQRCALTGLTPCEYAHVRRAGDSGTAYKPKYSGIPLTHEAHAYQHQHGEQACIEHYKVDTKGKTAKEWFDHLAQNFLRTWLLHELREAVNHDSLTSLAPVEFFTWCRQNDLGDEVPQKLRDHYG